MKKNDPPVVVEQRFEASIEAVWKAISQIDEMKIWYFADIPDFKAEIGFETQFTVKSGGRDFLHQWKVTEVVPLKKVVYQWRYAQYDGQATVGFELQPDEAGTRLTVSVYTTVDFPVDIPEFTEESCRSGWEYFIQQRLQLYFASR